METVRVGGRTLRIVLLRDFPYPALLVGDTILVEDTGDARLNRAVALLATEKAIASG